MFKIEQESENVFKITCDGFDKRIIVATITEKPVSIIDLSLSVVRAFVKGAKLVLYPNG